MSRWLFLLLAAASLGCTGGELPLVDKCAVDDSDNSQWCLSCQANDECVVAGNPCCIPDLKYFCVHKNAVERIEPCDVDCVAIVQPPPDLRCVCQSGRCAQQ